MQDIRDPYGIFSKVCFSRFPTPTPVSSTPLALLTSFVSPYLLSYPIFMPNLSVCPIRFLFLSTSSYPLLVFFIASVGFHETFQRQRKIKLLSKPTAP